MYSNITRLYPIANTVTAFYLESMLGQFTQKVSGDGLGRNPQFKKYMHLDINTLKWDYEQGNISKTTVLQILEIFRELGRHAENDMRAIEAGSEVGMPVALSGEENVMKTLAKGLTGQPLYGSVKDATHNMASSQNCQLAQLSDYKNAEKISLQIEKNCYSIKAELEGLACKIQGWALETNGQPLHSQTELFSTLRTFYDYLLGLQELERRHQALAYATLGPQKDFSGCLHESFASFFTCLRIFQDWVTDDQQNTDVASLFKEALQSSWILEDGPLRSMKLTKGSTGPKISFDINLRFLGNQEEWSQMDLRKTEFVLSVESKDGQHVNCKIHHEQPSCQENSLNIKKISFENFHKLSGHGLAHYQNFYVLKVNLQVPYPDGKIDLEFKTFPFTVYDSANQIQASMGAVTWLVFSQDEMKGDKYELKKTLPRQDVLQMFNLMVKNNTADGGKFLEEKEWQELGRLLGRQNPSNSVSMASILTDPMKAQRDRKQDPDEDSLKFPLFTWFQGGLNTLALFHEFWMEGIILGFYSKEDASQVLKLQGCKEGDTVVRLSQSAMFQSQSITPYTNVTVQFALDHGKIFIGTFTVTKSSEFQTLVLNYTRRTGDAIMPSIKQFLPKGIPLSCVCPHSDQRFAGSVEKNRYECLVRTSEEPLPERLEAMSLEDRTTPEQQILHGNQNLFQQQIQQGNQIHHEQLIPNGHQNLLEQQIPYGVLNFLEQHFPYGQQNFPQQHIPPGEQNLPEQQFFYDDQDLLKQHLPLGNQHFPEQQNPNGNPNFPEQQIPNGNPNFPEQQIPNGNPNFREQQIPNGNQNLGQQILHGNQRLVEQLIHPRNESLLERLILHANPNPLAQQIPDGNQILPEQQILPRSPPEKTEEPPCKKIFCKCPEMMNCQKDPMMPSAIDSEDVSKWS